MTVDWTVKETGEAPYLVKRKLRSHGYPPDKTKTAVDTIIK